MWQFEFPGKMVKGTLTKKAQLPLLTSWAF
jgi:hypothetical protein